MASKLLTQHYEQLLGLQAPVHIEEVELDHGATKLRIRVACGQRALRCPECDARCGRHDARVRRWRHMDTMQYTTIIEAEVPRVRWPSHGVHEVAVPWAEEGSRYAALCEAVVIDWLKEASVQAGARQLRVTWDRVAGIQSRAVQRALARREAHQPRIISVDETSFQKRLEYVTVVNDLASGTVLHVADDPRQEVLEA